MYAVYRGREGNHIYKSWPDAQAAITGVGGARVKKFKQLCDAQTFCETGDYSITNKEEEPTSDVYEVYTDGSALHNGKAGIGVFFGNGHPLNLSEAFDKVPNTNQRAELWAVIRALQQINTNSSLRWPSVIRVVTDSSYVIGCATTWAPAWKRTNFRNNTIYNRALIEQLWAEKEKVSAFCVVEFKWVKGHSDTYGNVEADKLAAAGSCIRV